MEEILEKNLVWIEYRDHGSHDDVLKVRARDLLVLGTFDNYWGCGKIGTNLKSKEVVISYDILHKK